MMGERMRLSRVPSLLLKLEDAWRHGTSPVCLETRSLELGYCLWQEPFAEVGLGK